MKTLLIATTNQGKFKEFEKILSPYFVCESLPKGIPEADEDGNTYAENAEKKARFYFEKFKTPVLSDDSGLEVEGLNGQPGVHSARFAGNIITWPERWALLLEKLGSGNRTARFRSVLCYFDGKTARFFEGKTEGTILPKPEGAGGFGYDPIFYSNDLRKSFGVASAEEKNRISHRARAITQFVEWVRSA